MDDLDDMLDEAEMKFCPKISYEKKHSTKKQNITTKTHIAKLIICCFPFKYNIV